MTGSSSHVAPAAFATPATGSNAGSAWPSATASPAAPQRPSLGRASGRGGLDGLGPAAARPRHGLAGSCAPRMAGLVRGASRTRTWSSPPEPAPATLPVFPWAGRSPCAPRPAIAVSGVAVVNPGLSFYDHRVRFIGLLKYLQPDHRSRPRGEPDGVAHRRRRLLPHPARGRPPAAPAVHRGAPGATPASRRRRWSSNRTPMWLCHRPRWPCCGGGSDRVSWKWSGLPHSGHVATLDADAPLIFEQSTRFFPPARALLTGCPRTSETS